MTLTDKQKRRLQWASAILALLSLVAGAVAAADVLPVAGIRWAALVAAILGIGSRWCEQQLPASGDKPPDKPGEAKDPP